jgi:formamidopyrimidine-DNA glycosylase
MPELPETETIAQDLHGMIRGARITEVRVPRPDVLRETDEQAMRRDVHHGVVQRVWRRAKLIVLDVRLPTDETRHLVVQPRFTGALLVDDGTLDAELREYVCVTFTLADGRALHYRDVRRLGTVSLMTEARFRAYEEALGLEPLSDACTPNGLRDALGTSTRAIKAVLMDQTRLAGVGNIYATEACWAASVDPSRAAASLIDAEWKRLHAELQRVLRASVLARGTSFRDYRDATGSRGAFVSQLQAYGRAGERCPRCAHTLIGTSAVDGRMTVFCAWCQR